MPITSETQNPTHQEQEVRQSLPSESPAPARRPIPSPGRKMSFAEALETTAREDKELLRRLAK